MVKVIDLRPDARPVDCGIVYDSKEVPSGARYYGPFGRVEENTPAQEVWRIRAELVKHGVFIPGDDFLFVMCENFISNPRYVLSWVEPGGYIRNANPRR